MPGRKPKPTKLKILEGNPGKKRLPEPFMVQEGMPEPPPYLDDYALDEWHRVVPGLFAIGILSELDQNTLGAYCTSYSTFRHAQEALNELRKSGELNALITKTASGNIIPQVILGVSQKAKADMMRYANEFAMTSVARARIALGGRTPKSKFDGLMGKSSGKAVQKSSKHN